MAAEAFLETTEWKGSTVKNGTYLLEGNKCIAFRNFRGETTYFKIPLTIDKRGRKFEKLTKIPFKVAKDDTRDSNVVEVKGSKGETYFVNKADSICSCPGFQFRGKCKHLEM